MISVRSIDPVVGFRLAGLVDGEGCFHISAPRAKGNYYCSFIVKMRADDEPLLALFRDACDGIGGLYRHERKNAWAPTVSWIVRKKAEVAFIRDLFGLYPLWSKKERDFEVWARAVDFWLSVGGGSTDWTRFEELRDELRAVRQFEEVAA